MHESTPGYRPPEPPKPEATHMSLAALAARFLLRRGFQLPLAGDLALTEAHIEPGITALLSPTPSWVWPLAVAMHEQFRDSSTRSAINAAKPELLNAEPLSDFPWLLKREESTKRVSVQCANSGSPPDTNPIIILVPGDHPGKPAQTSVGGFERVSFASEESFLVSLSDMMVRRMRVVIITTGTEELPKLVQSVVDRTIPVSGMDEPILRAVVNRAFKRRKRYIEPPLWPVEPVHLDLAVRPGQSPKAYLDCLRGLAPQQKAPLTAPAIAGFPRRLCDVHGMDEAIAWARQLVEDLTAYRAGAFGWADIDRGAVFHGPPGTGKTRLAALIAVEAGVPFIPASAAKWQAAGHLDDFLRAMAETFRQARADTPSILFIDELDSFWSRSARPDHNSSYTTSVIDGLLEQLDGTAGRQDVVVLGATNHIDRIDPALLRAGRFDRVITIPLPNYDALLGIIRFYTEDRFTDSELRDCALHAVQRDATGADVERWARGMRRRARREHRDPTIADLLAEIGG